MKKSPSNFTHMHSLKQATCLLPGPFALRDLSRPNLKITALSYSLTIYEHADYVNMVAGKVCDIVNFVFTDLAYFNCVEQ